MPYTHRKIGNKQCVFKKEDGSKVGCTSGSIEKYLGALHANADESVEPTETNLIKAGKHTKKVEVKENTKTLIKRLIRERMLLFENENNYFNLLKDKLLSFGGTKVNEIFEEDLDKLLTNGKLFKPSKILVVKMKISRCHENSACFWNNYTNEHGSEDMKIVTGWVLDSDTWYQHTWLYQPKENRIIETTHKRKLYFGYILSDDEAKKFYFDNY